MTFELRPEERAMWLKLEGVGARQREQHLQSPEAGGSSEGSHVAGGSEWEEVRARRR